MDSDHDSLGKKAFGNGADTIIRYRAHTDALKSLESALSYSSGVGVLHGPPGSGKSTIVRELARKHVGDASLAIVDGKRLKPHKLLTSMLAQYGEDAKADFDDELFKMVSAFAMQQTRTYQPPILIVDDADRMYPSALRLINALAGLNVRQRFALRIILTGHDGLIALIESDGMAGIAERGPSHHALRRLTARETMIYLHTKLQAAGGHNADSMFPLDVCDRLREQSDGWPGTLNRYALEAIERAAQFPVSVVDTYTSAAEEPVAEKGPPRVIMSRDGEMLGEFRFKENKVLIGRSEFADIVVPDQYASKMHAIMLLYSDALVLLDLNSANGTTVNSVKVRSTVLKDDDVITLGNHRLKIADAPEISEEMQKAVLSSDTVKMRSLVDIRRIKARQRTKRA